MAESAARRQGEQLALVRDEARSSTTCSVTRARTRGRVITWRLPRTLPPVRGTWQSGQLAVACPSAGPFPFSLGAGGPVGLDPRRRLQHRSAFVGLPTRRLQELGYDQRADQPAAGEPGQILRQPSVYIFLHSWAQRPSLSYPQRRGLARLAGSGIMKDRFVRERGGFAEGKAG